jgi:uncharacterized protein (DUF924 family)
LNVQARDVLDFWFGAPGSPEHGRERDAWFTKDEAFDRLIGERFGAVIEAALAGGLADWAEAPDSALALVIVLDQFTRNAYRGTPRSFAGDAMALRSAREMVARGSDLTLLPVQRAFAYLPFEHAEDLAAQRESLHLFAQLAEADASLAGYADYARRHHDIIERFGRFPHRNAILGRVSTPEELEFLKQPGSGF